MKRPVITFTLIFLVINSYSQDKTPVKLPVAIEELTSPDFALAVKKSKRTCIIPLGILEKVGLQLRYCCMARPVYFGHNLLVLQGS
ncbi:hypothetical protein ES703_67691 [subsurface metagenome]